MKTYTVKNTINDILKDELLMKRFQFMMPKEFLDIVPAELRKEEIESLQDKLRMPWGAPYLGSEIVDVANKVYEISFDDRFELIKLWAEDIEEDYFPSGKEEDSVCLIRFKESFQKGRPIAIIVPGGAYHDVAIANEGMEVAAELMKLGYAVAVLNYRVTPNHYPLPQMDLALAIKYMRYHASEYGVLDNIMTVGFSAGGHLVASEACYPEEINGTLMEILENKKSALAEKYRGIPVKPEKVCLSYPVINFVEDKHEESYINLTGGGDELRKKLSVGLNVTLDYPKTFVWACDDDALVPASNSKRMYEALQKSGVESELHIYPTGGHGIATGKGTSAEGWIQSLVGFMK